MVGVAASGAPSDLEGVGVLAATPPRIESLAYEGGGAMAFFTLRFVSPSRLAVSTYANELGSVLESSTRSAGISWSRSTRSSMPTLTSRHVTSVSLPWAPMTATVRALTSLSLLWRQ